VSGQCFGTDRLSQNFGTRSVFRTASNPRIAQYYWQCGGSLQSITVSLYWNCSFIPTTTHIYNPTQNSPSLSSSREQPISTITHKTHQVSPHPENNPHLQPYTTLTKSLLIARTTHIYNNHTQHSPSLSSSQEQPTSTTAHNTHHNCVCVVHPEDGQVMPKTCRDFKLQ
jgi:hypothetical protein